MYAFTALLPILAALIMMCCFKLSPGKVMPASWLLAAATALSVWRISLPTAAAATIQGVFKSLDIIFIIVGSVWLLNVLRESGAIDSISRSFSGISGDRRIQMLTIAWLFGGFVEGAAGFGAAPALAAPLLAGTGFPPLIAVSCALICNTLPVPFGAVGLPVKTSLSVISGQLRDCGISPEKFNGEMLDKLTAISGISGMFIPLIAVAVMIILSGEKHKLRSILEIAPLALFAGAAYIIPWRFTTLHFGVELPSMVGALVGLPLTLLMVKLKLLVPRRVWDFPCGTPVRQRTENHAAAEKSIDPYLAWLPYIVLAAALFVLRMNGTGLKNLLDSCTIRLPEMFGVTGSGAQWHFLNNPGIMPVSLIAVGCAWCWKIPGKALLKTFSVTVRQTGTSAIAIAAGVALVQIMTVSGQNASGEPGMLSCIAQAAAELFGGAYLAGALLTGVFGTFFSGSCTVSNILFAPLQFDTAGVLSLSRPLIAALQNIGGGIGSMIRISGVIAACATVNISGKEGKLILINSIPALFIAALTALAAWMIG